MIEPSALSVRLRSSTLSAHRAAEAAVDLDGRLASRSSYVQLLRDFRAFFAPAEASLTAVTGWDKLHPAMELAERRRAHLLDTDLAALGIVDADGAHPVPDVLKPTSLAEGLGVLYVLEGSALGGQHIATRARRVLGADLPVSFFTSVGRADPRSSWKAVQGALDNFALAGTERDSTDAIRAAEATFESLADWFSPQVVGV